MKYYIGIDVGGTNIAAGVVSEEYEISGVSSIKTNAPRSAESVCDDITELCKTVCKKANVSFDEILGIGVASPGIIRDGIIYFAKNLGFDNVNIKELLGQRTGKPIAVCNDANAAALAECMVGSGKGSDSLVAVTIGTGIGGGIIINNKIVEGFNGAGAEVGHFMIVPDGRTCGCGNKGCIEAYCSATALIRDTKEAMQKNPESALWQICSNIEDVNGRTVYKAAAMGDTVAKEVLDNFIKYLSIGVANLIILLQPNVLCIGGGMSAEEEMLIKPLIKRVNETPLIKSLAKKTHITAALLHNNAGILGAAADIMGEMKNG